MLGSPRLETQRLRPLGWTLDSRPRVFGPENPSEGWTGSGSRGLAGRLVPPPDAHGRAVFVRAVEKPAVRRPGQVPWTTVRPRLRQRMERQRARGRIEPVDGQSIGRDLGRHDPGLRRGEQGDVRFRPAVHGRRSAGRVASSRQRGRRRPGRWRWRRGGGAAHDPRRRFEQGPVRRQPEGHHLVRGEVGRHQIAAAPVDHAMGGANATRVDRVEEAERTAFNPKRRPGRAPSLLERSALPCIERAAARMDDQIGWRADPGGQGKVADRPLRRIELGRRPSPGACWPRSGGPSPAV